jgi:hypothetical protein
MVVEVISDVFEIYNNEDPRAFIYSPLKDEVVTGTLNIEWRIEDEEDEAWGIVDEMMGNFSVLKEGEEEWLTLFLDHLDIYMAVKSFGTSELQGDGEYTLRFTVTDTRGRSSYAERQFAVYDPDPPEFLGQVEGPADTSDIKSDTLHITWAAHDPDEGESISYTLEISPAELDDWMVVETDLIGNSYDLDLLQLEQGRYKLRLTANDDSGLSSPVSIEYGPFYYNAPEAPSVTWLYPESSFNGTIEDELGVANETGIFLIDLLWSGYDPDGDNITYSLYWKTEGASEWSRLKQGLKESAYSWNVTTFTDGSYLLKIDAKDSSSDELLTTTILGPFSIDIPWDPPVGDDDDIVGDDDVTSDEGIDIVVIVAIAAGSVVFVIILVIVILVVLSKTTGKSPDETPVIPTQKDVDYSIPEFDRAYQQPAVTSGQMVSQGPYTGVQQQPMEAVPSQPQEAAAPLPINSQVSWESSEEAAPEQQVEETTEGVPQPEGIPQEEVAEQVAPEAASPMAPPPAMPEVLQGPPPLPPQE